MQQILDQKRAVDCCRCCARRAGRWAMALRPAREFRNRKAARADRRPARRRRRRWRRARTKECAAQRRPGADFGAHAGGLTGLGVKWAPNRARPGQHTPIRSAPHLRMTLESQSRGRAHPRTRADLVTPERRLLVVDLMAHHHPPQLGLIGCRRYGPPVGHRGVLDPAEVDHISRQRF